MADVQPIDYRRGFAWNLALNVLTKIATPLMAIFVARTLGPAIMGTYAIVTTILIFSDVFRDSVLVRVYLREPSSDKETDRSYAALSVGVHLALAVAVAALGWPFAQAFHTDLLLWGLPVAAVAVALNGASALPYTKLLRRGDFKQAALAESLGSVLSSAYALGMVFAGAGFWALVGMALVRSVIFLALTLRFAPTGVGRGALALFRRIRGMSGELTITNLLWVGFSFGDQLLVSKLLGVATGGFYATGKMMVQTADVLAKPLMQTTTVAFADRKEDPNEIARTLGKALMAFLVVIAPIYAVVAIFAKPLVIGVLSEKFAGTVALIPPLCLYFASIYPGSFAADALVMAGKARIPLLGWIANYVYLGLMIGLFWRGGDAASLAWILASGLVLVNLSTLYFALRHYRVPASSVKTAGKAGVAMVSTVAVALAVYQVQAPDLLKAGLALLIVPAAHAAILGLLFLANPLALRNKRSLGTLWAAL